MDANKIIKREKNARKRINQANKTIRNAKNQLVNQLGKDIKKTYKVNTLSEFKNKYDITPKK